MAVTFQIKKDYSKMAIAAKDAQCGLGLMLIGAQAEKYAKADCPVKTGRLRNSISHAVVGKNVYIGTNVDYAKYVEFNEKAIHKTGRAHFLRDAAKNHGDVYAKIMQLAMLGQ